MGGLRAEMVGGEVWVYDDIDFRWQVYPISHEPALRHGGVAAIFDGGGRDWALDRNGTRLHAIWKVGSGFAGYELAGPIGEYGWLLDLAQEAGLVLNATETVNG